MAQVDQEQKMFSFGFAKKKDQKKLVKAAIKDDDVDQIHETEYVSSLEDKTLQSNKAKDEKKELVIPMIKSNKWHVPTPNEIEQDGTSGSHNTDTTEARIPEVTLTGDAITDEALQELVSEAKKQSDEWDERGGVKDHNRAIPLLLRNKIPDGFETDDKLDVSLRPDEAAEADYEQIPIEEYGMALLRGMGFKTGEGVGKNKKSVAPIEAVARPKGLGLGADRSLNLQQKDGGKTGGKSSREEEDLDMKKGAFCLVQGGKHEGLYAKVEGIDEDNARVVIKLSIGGNIVTLNQMAVKLVTRKDYDKNSKYLNKTKVDKYKEEHKDRDHRSHGGDKDNGHHSDSRSDRHRDKRRDREAHRDQYKEQERSTAHDDRDSHRDRNGHEKQRHRDRHSNRHPDSPEHSRHKKEKHRNVDKGSRRDRSRSPLEVQKKKKTHDRIDPDPRGGDFGSLWLRPHLRVRIIDPEFKKGKYFKSKVIIEDVISRDTCICKTDEGKVLEGLTQSQLETVIPKSKTAYVMVVCGRHKGKVGEIMEKDSSSCSAVVKILPDCDEILSLSYDVICEFAGRLEDLNL